MQRPMAMLALAILAACARPPGPNEPSPQRRGALPESFARVLAQYDADLSTLRRLQNGTPSAGFDAAVGNARASVARDAVIAATQTRRLDLGAPPEGRTIAAAPDPIGPQALGSFRSAWQKRIDRALSLRRQQLREREADVAYAFERAHAGQRLILRVRLRELHLDSAAAVRYRAQLRALDAREAALVGAQRTRDAGVLTAYASRLRAQADRDIAAMASELAAHQRSVAAVPAPSNARIPAHLTRDTRAQAAAAFRDAGNGLAQNFATLQRSHDDARASLAREIAQLQRERDALVAEMRAADANMPAVNKR